MQTLAVKCKYLRANCKICELCEKLRSARSQICAKIAARQNLQKKLRFPQKGEILRKNCAPQDRDFLQGLAVRLLSVLSVCDFGALWPNGWIDPDET